jgi:hypothetical protein
MWDCNGHSQFALWGRVFPAVAFNLLLQGGPVDGSGLFLVCGAGLVVQLEGLGDGCQRLLDSLSADAIISSCVSTSYPMGKGLDEGKSLWVGQVGEERVGDSKIVVDKEGPVSPEFFPCVVSRSHDPMGCRSRRSSEKTKEQILVLRVCVCQEASCERGNLQLNMVSNSASVRS